MALVYEGRRESLAGVSPRVAIKVILPEYGDVETFKTLFINEARLGASLHHQNLVQIQDFNRDGNRFYLVMEYIEGITLRRTISLCRRHGVRIPTGVIAEIGRQACDGLHYAHQARNEEGKHLRLVHRDVKPSNLILNPHGVVKLLDFGISKGRLIRERQGTVKGTWGYMAPEQAFGKDVGPEADVFGLATVLYELASLRVLFEGQDKTQIKRLLMDDHAARMAATLDPTAYGTLVPVLVRALQRDPAARYASAADFGRALSALLPDPITARDEVVAFYRMVHALHEGVPLEKAARELRSEPAPSQGSIVASAHSTGAGDSSAPLWILAALAAFAFALVLIFATILVFQSHWMGAPESRADHTPSMADVIGDDHAAAPHPAADEPPGPAGVGAPGEDRPPPVAERSVPEERPPPQQTPLPAPTTLPEPMPEPSTTTATATPTPTGGAPAPQKITVPAPSPAPAHPKDAPILVVRKVEPSSGTGDAAAATSEEPGLLTVGARQEGEVYVDGKFVRKIPLFLHELPPGHHTVNIVANDGRTKQFEIDLKPGQKIQRVWDFDRGEWRKVNAP